MWVVYKCVKKPSFVLMCSPSEPEAEVQIPQYFKFCGPSPAPQPFSVSLLENNQDYHCNSFLPCLYFIIISCLAPQIDTYHYQTIPNLANYKTLCIMMSFIPEVCSLQRLLSPYKANEERLKLLWGKGWGTFWYTIQKKSLVHKRVRGLINK